MQLQGLSPTNSDYFKNIEAQIRGCKTKEHLDLIVSSCTDDLSAYKKGIEAQIKLLAPILALLEVPANPIAAVTWIGNFISGFLTPYVVPYTNYVTQLSDLSGAVSGLQNAIKDVSLDLDIEVAGIDIGVSIPLPVPLP
jgi:hypothetical protein